MKNKTLKLVLVSGVLVCLGHLLLISAEQTSLESTFETINAEFNKLWAEQKLDLMSKFLADDVIMMPNYGSMLKGKEAFMSAMKTMQSIDIKMTYSNNVLQTMKSGEFVIEIGTYEASYDIPNISARCETGAYMTVWQEMPDGSYQVKFSIWNTSNEPIQTMMNSSSK